MKFTIVYSILVFCLSGKLVLSSSESGTPIHADQTAKTNTNTTIAIKDIGTPPPQPPPTTIEPNSTSTTSTAPPTTSATPPTKPTTVPTTAPTTPPTTPSSTTPPPTTPPPTTPSTAPTTTVAPSTTPSPAPDRKFDSPSFIGGFVLCMGLTAIAFISFKFYKARTERNYHTL